MTGIVSVEVAWYSGFGWGARDEECFGTCRLNRITCRGSGEDCWSVKDCSEPKEEMPQNGLKERVHSDSHGDPYGQRVRRTWLNPT